MLVLNVFLFFFVVPEKETFLEPFVLRDLLPSSIGSYYRYIGSLTTPPCSKVVEWIVFSRPVFLSYKQVSLYYTYEGVLRLFMLFGSLKDSQIIPKKQKLFYLLKAKPKVTFPIIQSGWPSWEVWGVNTVWDLLDRAHKKHLGFGATAKQHEK